MEKTLISNNFMCLKFIKNTILFGISYDRPHLYIAFFCFLIEIDFARSKKRPQKF
jgi:hypothetical protein